MSDQQPNEPPWLAAWKNGGQAAQPLRPDEPKRGPDGRVLSGVMNPNGKPAGTKAQRTILGELIDQGIDAVVAVVHDKALRGDMQAANLLLSRVIPPKRAVAERTPFALDTSQPRAAQAQAILAAVAAGELDSDAAKVLMDCLTAAAGLEKLDLYERQIAELLAKQAARDKRDGALGGVVFEGKDSAGGDGELPEGHGAPIYPYED